MEDQRHRLCWITPCYFLPVDSEIVPKLMACYNIKWFLVNTLSTPEVTEALVDGDLRPEVHRLRYRQRDPRVLLQYRHLVNAVEAAHPDVVYTSFHGLPYFLPFLAASVDANKIIYAVHNVRTPKGATNEWSMRLYNRYAFRRLRHFQVFSSYQLRIIADSAPNKDCYFTPLPIKCYGSSPELPPSDTVRFLFFGYVRRYKGLDLLLQAFDSIYTKGITNIELVIAGKFVDRHLYAPLMRSGVPIVVIDEFVPVQSVPGILASCHYVVLPYRDSAQSAVVELAYQYGKPVIASDIAAFQHTVVDGKTGRLFDANSIASLAQILETVVNAHPGMYCRLRDSVRQFWALEYSLESILARYRDCIDGSVADNRRRGQSQVA